MDYTDLTKAFGAFFAIMNPFVNLPIFLAMTNGFTVSEQRILATKLATFSAIMCLIVLLVGQQVLQLFGISIDHFRIAGGVVLAHIAWSMLNGKEIASHHGTEKEKSHLSELSTMAFYPLTFPVIVGPGSIATLIIYAGHADSFRELGVVALIVGVVLALLFFVLFFASYFGKVLSDTMRVIMSRLMGMILLAIAIDMVLSGLLAVMPGLS